MDLKYLKTFRVIVEEGSFSKAAERLNYTQSTITFQMGQLEEELSAKLFEKVGRRMVLTKAGEGLIPYVEEVLSSVDKLRCFQDDLDQCRGDLRIGVAETQLCYRMPPVLKEFCRRAPKARLFIRSMNCYDIRDELLEGKLDVGVFYADVGGFGDSITTYPMGEWPVVAAASPGMKEVGLDFKTPNREITVPLVINEPNSIFCQSLEESLRERAIRLDRTIELESIHTIKRMVESDVGFTVLPRFTMEEELAGQTLVEVEMPGEPVVLHAVCGHHKNKWLSPLIRLFLELAKESLS